MPFFVGTMLTNFELMCAFFCRSTSRHYLDMRSLMADADYTPLQPTKASSCYTAPAEYGWRYRFDGDAPMNATQSN